MLDEDQPHPLTTLDHIPTASGFTLDEIEKTLNENKLMEQHLIWAEYLGDSLGVDKNSVNLDILFNGILFPTLAPLHWTLEQLKLNIYKHMKKSVVIK